MSKVHFGLDAKKEELRGMKIAADAVATTLGAGGKVVRMYQHVTTQEGRVLEMAQSTKDGVSVIEAIVLDQEGQLAAMGAKSIKNVAKATRDAAGDGTTTASILMYALCEQGLKAIENGANVRELTEEMEAACRNVVAKLKELSQPVTPETLLQIATISTNNDPVMGKIVADAYIAAGEGGIVNVELGSTYDTTIDVVDGFSFNRGYISPKFSTEIDTRCIYEDCAILLLNEKVEANQLGAVLKTAAGQGFNAPLLIIADDFEPTVAAWSIMNKEQYGMKICLVKAPESNNLRDMLMEDIATVTGGTYLNKLHGKSLKWINETFKKEGNSFKIADLFGTAKIIVDSVSTIILDGAGYQNVEKIETLKATINAAIETEKDPLGVAFYKKRLQNIAGSIATIKVGGVTEQQAGERKDRFDDAVCAIAAAKQEGYVAGGGTALAWIAPIIYKVSGGTNVVYGALWKPHDTIILNAGMNIDLLGVLSVFGYGGGYNAKTRKHCNLFDEGIIDATKAIRCALEYAVSEACLFLNSEVSITQY